MGSSPVHTITFGRVAPCLPVRDIQAAFAFYSAFPAFRKFSRTAILSGSWC